MFTVASQTPNYDKTRKNGFIRTKATIGGTCKARRVTSQRNSRRSMDGGGKWQ